jgi:pilus assembly protein FimV
VACSLFLGQTGSGRAKFQMAFNKNKALENALKFLNQGKVAQAIGEYQQILRHDAKDQATLMTVGDLFARQGDMPQAIEYFERLAQVYLSDGFNSKAIAIYKKIAKLAPAELAPLERLADLYVQQGVLSEARPLFLQIAEAHLKANHAPKAVEVLHRLLEVEPENPRVQMRLAELYNVMGQKKEAANTYLSYAQRLFERDDPGEAAKLIERALEVEPGNATALLLKAKILSTSSKPEHAIPILEKHPEANEGGDVTNLLLDLELKSGHTQKAAERARKQMERGHEHTGHLQRVAETLIEGGKTEEVLPILQELRGPMIEAGEQDKFLKLLTGAVERQPGQVVLLEMFVDFCRHTSDSFRLPEAINKLADAYAAMGDYSRAEGLIQELIDKNKDDERLVERLDQLRARRGGAGPSALESKHPEPAPVAHDEAEEGPVDEAAPTLSAETEEALDDETQRYIAQALTDVDLFSSYGLTQKATHLLENVLQRAPRHTPTLERLLDLYLGAGNERRTAEMASQLEQIHRERGDTVNAERFTELRQRFQKAAGLTAEDLPAAPPAVVAAPPAAEPQASAQAAPVDVAPEPEAFVAPAATPDPAGPAEFEISVAPLEPETDELVAPAEPEPAAAVPQAAAPTEEVDLSDEWEAMALEVEEPAAAATEAPALEPAHVPEVEPEAEPEAVHVPEPAAEEPQIIELELAPEPESEPARELDVELDPVIQPVQEIESEPEPEPVEELDLTEELAQKAPKESVEEPAAEPAFEIVEESAAEPETAETLAAGNGDLELELTPEPAAHAGKSGPTTTDDFLSELAAEIDDMQVPGAAPAVASRSVREDAGAAAQAPVAVASAATQEQAAIPAPTAASLNELAEVFQEFRNELGELGEEDEDLETHYNLGIAYREMGLLDEAIGEFQKVAKAVQKGKPFAYAMNCSTLLALTFIEKGEPKIASMWYKRALEVPSLEQETILALRYDLGVALEMAGESTAALDSFRQVYAMNIDYRDVADHIATLQKR